MINLELLINKNLIDLSIFQLAHWLIVKLFC